MQTKDQEILFYCLVNAWDTTTNNIGGGQSGMEKIITVDYTCVQKK